MSLEEKLSIKKCTNKKRQWSWFIILWFGGLGSVLILATIIKFIIKLG